MKFTISTIKRNKSIVISFPAICIIMANCVLSISVEAAAPPIQRSPLLDEQQRLRSEEIKRKQKFTPGQDLKYKRCRTSSWYQCKASRSWW